MSEANKSCECGCGQPAPGRFVKGHNMRGAGHHSWREREVDYHTLHAWLRNHYPKAGVCDECGAQAETDYALIKGREYSRDRDDYRELCRQCHVLYDGIGGSRWWHVQTARQVAGDAPQCACGCGEQMTWDRRHARWFRYAPGHYEPAAHLNQERLVV